MLTLLPACITLALSLWCSVLVRSWCRGVLVLHTWRLLFLANPQRASLEFCAEEPATGCRLRAEVRTQTNGWEDFCADGGETSWQAPRYVRLGMHCQSGVGFATVRIDGPLFEFLTRP